MLVINIQIILGILTNSKKFKPKTVYVIPIVTIAATMELINNHLLGLSLKKGSLVLKENIITNSVNTDSTNQAVLNK